MNRRSTAVCARRRPTGGSAPLLTFQSDRGGGVVSTVPEGFSAVMAHRVSDTGDLDYFPTPPWAARAGGELIRAIDPKARSCWEPASGGGHMAWGLMDYFPDGVSISDIHDHGGPLSPRFMLGDFLDPVFGSGIEADWIATNPPFVRGEAFIREAWRRARRGVAMLLRLQFIESEARYRLFQDIPLYALAPFAERVPMVKGRWDPAASSATAYAWFIFVKPGVVQDAGAAPRVIIVPPGSKTRLSRRADLTQFCGQADAPLLEVRA